MENFSIIRVTLLIYILPTAVAKKGPWNHEGGKALAKSLLQSFLMPSLTRFHRADIVPLLWITPLRGKNRHTANYQTSFEH